MTDPEHAKGGIRLERPAAFHRDPIWDSFAVEGPDHFDMIASSLEFREGVPDDVRSRFVVIRKLIAYSYFDYDLLDPAYERAMLTLELALKSRLKELGGPPARLTHLRG